MAISTSIKQLSIAVPRATLMALGTAAPSMAASFTYNGTTAGAGVPTWRRPDANAGNPPSSYATGNNQGSTRYSVFNFTVSQNGNYTFGNNPASGFNSFLVLYQNAFNPTASLPNSNALRAVNANTLTQTLSAGVSYFLVTTGANNNQSGTFSNTITSANNIPNAQITPVPELLTILGSLATGGFVLGLRRKYKQNEKATAKV
jgi:hypothetical protein